MHLIQGEAILTTAILKSKQPLQFKNLLSQTLSTMPNTTPKIFNLSSYNFFDCDWTRTQNHSGHKRTLNQIQTNTSDFTPPSSKEFLDI